ncbi:Oidioi.mRNA.OKI2018_I69.XSR.g13837.t1.cds [Oikopleura dioica]|uniref:Oidioi.mRNA.OKI2018_I69.XSR.g13837.t1.cds n=1 Tax=Oikopleura dioica TaxID=34765 RepID=A0ABN7S836_OIKDI|nr:Oidioi.mRNA.OKI2018_I69.XSR.g13837.t1.cds [Oikopleura dioica]
MNYSNEPESYKAKVIQALLNEEEDPHEGIEWTTLEDFMADILPTRAELKVPTTKAKHPSAPSEEKLRSIKTILEEMRKNKENRVDLVQTSKNIQRTDDGFSFKPNSKNQE